MHKQQTRGQLPHNKLLYPESLRYLALWVLGKTLPLHVSHLLGQGPTLECQELAQKSASCLVCKLAGSLRCLCELTVQLSDWLDPCAAELTCPIHHNFEAQILMIWA